VKKTYRIIAATGTVAIMLAGCSSSKKTTSAPTTSAPAAATSAPAPATSAAAAPASSAAAPASSAAAPVSSAAAPASSAAAAGPVNACMVLDTGGVDDHSFNQSSWQGLQDANKANANIKISYVSSNTQNDYTPNLNAEVAKGCSTIIAVGGLMADAVKTAAAANPKQQFAEIDNPSTGPNVYGMQFNTAQGGFLGGYLAASVSKTGVVATFGGLNIPPVTIYMDGFWEGVQYYNKVKSKSVKVLGWNETNQKAGTFDPSTSNPFGDTAGGQAISKAFIAQGADVIFPVAGGTGEGAAIAAKASGGKVSVIWVDTDGCISDAADCSVFLSSVVKGLASAVTTYANDFAAGKSLGGGSYIGTLANNGTGLAPFHDFASKVPANVQTELTQITSDIESGKIPITSPSQPKA
jgi:basic membrane protein A and related proteins